MKILLDECIPKKAKSLLKEYDVKTVPEMGFNGLKDGPLLSAAEKDKFDVLLTIDKNINKQQNVKKFKVSVVILDVLKSTVRHIEKLIPKFKSQIKTFEKGKSYIIERETNLCLLISNYAGYQLALSRS